MLSSLKLTSYTPLGKQETRKFKIVWQALQDSNDSLQFRLPVDWQGLGLTDYLTIVEHPMDLSTVNNKLEQQQYESVEEALDDMQLIWDNCKHYNQKGSWIYDKAQKLERLFKKQVKAQLPMIVLPGPPGKNNSSGNSKIETQEIKIEEKVKFVERIKVLRPEQLGVVVARIQELCPHTYKQGEGEKVQILIDQIDLNSWKKIVGALQDVEETHDAITKKQKA